ncbi:MAG: hypothetical protein V3S39_10020, partial [Thermodesulfobacteriota bacterium]
VMYGEKPLKLVITHNPFPNFGFDLDLRWRANLNRPARGEVVLGEGPTVLVPLGGLKCYRYLKPGQKVV